MGHKILLVEDSKEIQQMVQVAISGPLIDLSWAKTYAEAEECLKINSYSLVILDIELPDGNGLDLCNKLQMSSPETTVFFLTSHTELSEKVMGFSAGADDYITKPFAPLELKARVEARLKKLEILKQTSDILKWEEIEINKSSQEVEILRGDKFEKVELTALEFKILTFFANRPGEVIDRDTMLNEIWGKDVHVYSRSVDTHVSKLRKKLDSVSEIIESIHGVGYKFNPTNLS